VLRNLEIEVNLLLLKNLLNRKLEVMDNGKKLNLLLKVLNLLREFEVLEMRLRMKTEGGRAGELGELSFGGYRPGWESKKRESWVSELNAVKKLGKK